MESEIEFITTIVKMLVDYPEDVSVEKKIDEIGILLSVSVNKADLGRVIGREGSNAKAMRTLLKCFGARHEMKINLRIVDPYTRSLQSDESLDDL